MSWNPRFVAWALSAGMTPEQARQGKLWPFMVWISEKRAAAKRERPDLFQGDSIKDHDGFTAYCEGKLL